MVSCGPEVIHSEFQQRRGSRRLLPAYSLSPSINHSVFLSHFSFPTCSFYLPLSSPYFPLLSASSMHFVFPLTLIQFSLSSPPPISPCLWSESQRVGIEEVLHSAGETFPLLSFLCLKTFSTLTKGLQEERMKEAARVFPFSQSCCVLCFLLLNFPFLPSFTWDTVPFSHACFREVNLDFGSGPLN